MPKAKAICSTSKCLNTAVRDGRCNKHGRKPWMNMSKRNQNRPTDWNSRKAFVRKRDRGKCQKCGSTHNVEVDHRWPVAFGGSWEYENLWLLCVRCHKKKTIRDVVSK